MSELELFFKENVAEVETVKYAATARIKNKEGKPAEWELRAVSQTENEEIKKKCVIQKTDERGRRYKEFDDDKYAANLLVKSIIYPDLQNRELQDKWNVRDPVSLLREMLTAGEFTLLQDQALQVSGYRLPSQDQGIDPDLVEELEN